MLEVLHFVFSSFWVFLGSAFLLSIIGKIIIGLVAVLFARGNINIE
ncbi:hypothetical protein ACC734_16985 [Rhizobium ruizarguesonis]|nr:hypothetical protein [Rhizobium ruizarguesonis]